MTTPKYSPDRFADLVLRSGNCLVYYADTSTPAGVSYELAGMGYDGACPDCGSLDVRDTGSYDKCLNCGTRITMEYVEALIIASG